MRVRGLGWIVLGALLGCGAEGENEGEGGAAGCPDGTTLLADGSCGSPTTEPSCLEVDEILVDGLCVPVGVPPEGCAEGFVHDDEGGCAAILPEDPCPPGTMALPGETACREVAPCSPGTFGDIPVEVDTEHVDQAYAGGGSDGTAMAPWTTIQQAVNAAADGAIVAIAEGTYVENVLVENKSLRLWGVCPARVTIDGPAAGTGVCPPAAVCFATGADGSEVRRLTLTGQGVGLVGSGSVGILAEQLHVVNTARGVLFEDFYGPTSVTLRQSLVEDVREVGVVTTGAEVAVEESVVRGTVPDPVFDGGIGIGGQSHPQTGTRASIALRDAVIERNHRAGVVVTGIDAVIEAVAFRDTLPFEDRGYAIQVSDDPPVGEIADATIAGVVVERSWNAGMLVTGGRIAMSNSTVTDTLPAASVEVGHGIHVGPSELGTVEATFLDSTVRRSVQVGLYLAGAQAVVEGLLVRDTQAGQFGLGRGMQLQSAQPSGDPIELALARSAVLDSVDGGMFFTGPGTLSASDLVVRRTSSRFDGLFGDGLVFASTNGVAAATLTGLRVEDSDRAAVSSFGASVSLADATLTCQAFDLAAEMLEGQSAAFDDQGNVLCGCPEAEELCAAQSHQLEPPSAIGGEGQPQP